jgi:hypothetical protein
VNVFFSSWIWLWRIGRRRSEEGGQEWVGVLDRINMWGTSASYAQHQFYFICDPRSKVRVHQQGPDETDAVLSLPRS